VWVCGHMRKTRLKLCKRIQASLTKARVECPPNLTVTLHSIPLIAYCFTSCSGIFHSYGDVTIAIAKFRPMLGAQGLWTGRDLYRATPTVTRGLGFSCLFRRTAPLSHSYDTQGDAEDLFLPGTSCVSSIQSLLMTSTVSYPDPHGSLYTKTNNK
jgi:hypothetical protein